jgi:autotransporter-associated beta strand protein
VLASASGAGTNTITVSGAGSAALSLQATIMNALALSGTGGALGGALVNSSGADVTVGGNVTLAGNSTINTANPITLLGVVSGAFALTKAGASTLTLAGINTYSTGSNLTAGTLAFAYSGLGTAGAITFSGGSLRYLPGNSQDISSRLLIGAGSTAFIDTNGNNVTFGAGFGAASTGGLTKMGNGMLLLAGSNTYTGNTAVNAGVLQVGTANALPGFSAPGKVSIASGATLTLNVGGALDWSSTQLDTLRTNAAFSANSALGFDTSNGNFTYAGVMSGGSGVTKQGLNSLTLSGANTYTGPTTLLRGTLIAADVSALGAVGSSLNLRGGTLALATDSSVNAYNTTLSGGVTILSNRATGGSGIDQALGTLSLAGVTLSLLKGANVTSGTAGLTFGATTLTGQPVLNLGASTALSLGATNNGGFTPTVTGAGNFAATGVISGTGGLLLDSGFTGKATLSAATTYTGATNVASGSLVLDFSAGANSNILNASGSVAIGGATLLLLGKANSTNSQTLAGITLRPGATSVVLSPDATSNPLLLSLGTITRAVGSAVDFQRRRHLNGQCLRDSRRLRHSGRDRFCHCQRHQHRCPERAGRPTRLGRKRLRQLPTRREFFGKWSAQPEFAQTHQHRQLRRTRSGRQQHDFQRRGRPPVRRWSEQQLQHHRHGHCRGGGGQ